MERPDHVLVVDDDAEIRVLLGEYLERNGYRVSLATDGRDMRRLIASSHPDIVVLDLGLPSMSGVELIKRLARHPHVALKEAMGSAGSEPRRLPALKQIWNEPIVPLDLDPSQSDYAQNGWLVLTSGNGDVAGGSYSSPSTPWARKRKAAMA